MASKTRQSFTGLRPNKIRALAFGLVRVEVAFAPMVETVKRRQARMLDPESLTPLKQQYVNDDGVFVPRDEIAKGYDTPNGYVVLDPSEVDSLKALSEAALTLTRRVKMEDVDPLYYDGAPQALFPVDEAAAQGYALIAEVLGASDEGLIGETVDRGTTKTILIRWCAESGHLVAHTLTYHALIRWSQSDTIASKMKAVEKPAAEMVAMAKHVLDALPEGFDMSEVTDTYAEALDAAIDAKAQGTKVKAAKQPAATTAPDLVAALRASISEADAKKKGGIGGMDQKPRGTARKKKAKA